MNNKDTKKDKTDTIGQKPYKPVPSAPTTLTRDERRRAVRDIMVLKSTSSPTEIQRIMKRDLGVRPVRDTITNDVRIITESAQRRAYDMARGVYSVSAATELERVVQLGEEVRAVIPQCKPGAQYAMMVSAYISCLERAQLVREDCIIYPAQSPWHLPPEVEATLKELQHGEKQQPPTK